MIHDLAELDRVRAECRRMVGKRALTAAAASAVPIPGVDAAVDIGLLAEMLPAISKRFQLDHAQVEKLDPHLAQRVLVLASGMGNTLIGRVVTKRLVVALLRRVGLRVAAGSAAKYVPVLGTALAAGVGFAAIRAAGNSHIDDCYATAKRVMEEKRSAKDDREATPI